MKTVLIHFLRLSLALVLAVTIYFKFTAHPESKVVFDTLGMGAGGRLLIGSLELIAVLLLLFPGTVGWGALLAWGIMTGALIGHLTSLGWSGEIGVLGLMAIFNWGAALGLIALRIEHLPLYGNWARRGS